MGVEIEVVIQGLVERRRNAYCQRVLHWARQHAWNSFKGRHHMRVAKNAPFQGF